MRKNIETMISMLDLNEVPSAQKYRVLEDHFRQVIVEELNEAVEQVKVDNSLTDFISGIRLAQATIETTRF